MSSKQLKNFVEEQIILSYQAMYRVAYTYVKNETDAMDIVQESVYKAIRNSSLLKQPEYCKTWLLKIVMNTSINFINKRSKEVTLESFIDEGTLDHYCDVDLMEVLGKLNEKERSIIVLRYFEDRKIEEISEIIEENINTVKSTLYRALKKMRIELEEGEI